MRKPKKLTLARIMRAVERDENMGFCRACGTSRANVEPDAEHYPCENCDMPDVFGAEQLLIMGVGEED
jgi:hypothetical protein